MRIGLRTAVEEPSWKMKDTKPSVVALTRSALEVASGKPAAFGDLISVLVIGASEQETAAASDRCSHAVRTAAALILCARRQRRSLSTCNVESGASRFGGGQRRLLDRRATGGSSQTSSPQFTFLNPSEPVKRAVHNVLYSTVQTNRIVQRVRV